MSKKQKNKSISFTDTDGRWMLCKICQSEYVKVDEEQDYSNWLAKQISFEKMLAKKELDKNLLIAEK